MPKLVLISDTHGRHKYFQDELPTGDIIIHAGDISTIGRIEEIREFLDWFSSLEQYKHKIFIAGNHDFGLQRFPKELEEEIGIKYPNLIYLNDSGVTVEGYKFWGSPWTPWFNNWAFNLDVYQQVNHWDKIPIGTEVLITHGPPYGVLDEVERPRYGEEINKGCKYLGERIAKLPFLQLHVFGHIHEARGGRNIKGVRYVNASQLTLSYKPYKGIFTFNLTEKNKEEDDDRGKNYEFNDE